MHLSLSLSLLWPAGCRPADDSRPAMQPPGVPRASTHKDKHLTMIMMIVVIIVVIIVLIIVIAIIVIAIIVIVIIVIVIIVI